MRTQHGATLVELILGGGLGLIVVMVAVGLVSQHIGQLKRLNDAIEINSAQIEIQRALLNEATCRRNFAPPFTLDEALAAAPGYSRPLLRLVADSAGTLPIATVGNALSPGVPHIQVASINATNIRKTAADSFRYDLEVNLVGPGNQPLDTIRLPRQRLRSDPASPSGSKQITACSGAGGGGNTCQLITVDSPGVGRARAMCGATERLISGGGECLTPAGQPWSAVVPFNTFGYLRINAPVLIGNVWGWEADCYNEASNVVRARVYAYCCQI